MASRAKKTGPDDFDLLPPLPPEGPELDALIKAKVAEADADPRPYVPIDEAFKRIRANFARNG
jgi:hypothetical protein